MSCVVASVSLSPLFESQIDKGALLEYLSSGLNLAGCADFVTSPARTCSKAQASVKEGEVCVNDKTRQTLWRVYSRFPLASNVYMRCILDKML